MKNDAINIFNDAINIFIVYGPTGCGKTTKSKQIAEFLGCAAILDDVRSYDLIRIPFDYPNKKVLVLSSLAMHDFQDIPVNVKVISFSYICDIAGLTAKPPFHYSKNVKVGEVEILQTYTIHGESPSYLPVGNKYPCYLNEQGMTFFIEEDEPGEPCTHFLSDLNEDGINYKFHGIYDSAFLSLPDFSLNKWKKVDKKLPEIGQLVIASYIGEVGEQKTMAKYIRHNFCESGDNTHEFFLDIRSRNITPMRNVIKWIEVPEEF